MRQGATACAGLDERAQRLLFFLPSPEARRSVRVPLVALGASGRLVVRTDLQVHPNPNPELHFSSLPQSAPINYQKLCAMQASIATPSLGALQQAMRL